MQVRSGSEDAQDQAILLVEDDAATRNVVARHLRRSGFAVTAVESAEDAITTADAREQPFDVVISDVHLPGISGIDLASLLLMRSPTQPIVLVTGDPDEALARDALSRGPVTYLLKPFELFELDSAVRQAVVRHQQPPAPATRSPVIADSTSAGSGLPEDWLRYVDDHSYAGRGHADRVARIATELLGSVPEAAREISASDLTQAARAHEIGRLEGPTADPADMAVQGAVILAEAGAADTIVRAIRHLHERWDGTGGPDGLSGTDIPQGSLILAAADSIDHYCSAWIQAGMKAEDAVDRAIGLVVVQQSSLFSPIIAGAVHRQRAVIRAICTAERPRDDARLRAEADISPSGGVRSLRLA